MTLYTRSERADDIRLKNTSGGALVEGQLTVLGGQVVVANGAIASNAIGCFGFFPRGETFEVTAADLKAAEDTFATENQAVYFDSVTGKVSDTVTQGYYLIGLLQADKTASGIVFISVEPRLMDMLDANGSYVVGVATLTAIAAGTAVPVIADALVPAGKKLYLLGALLSVGGTTAWTDATATVVRLQDTAGSPVTAVTAAKAQLTSQAQLVFLSTGVTLATPVRTGVGLTAAKGLSVIGDANFTAGSDITVTAFGIIK